MIDIYRKTPISTTTDEHILQAGLGCNVKSAKLIDYATNNQFGDTIDTRLLDTLELVRVLSGLSSRRGKPLVAMPVEGDYRLYSDGRVTRQRDGKPWTVQESDGRTDIHIEAPTIKQAKELQRHALAKVGATPEQVKEQRVERVREYVNEPQHFKVCFSDPLSLRAIAKSAFNLFACTAGTDLALTPAFDELRAYILEGVDRYPELLDGGECQTKRLAGIETRDALFARVPKHFGVLEHRILVRAVAGTGAVYALIELFGHMRYSVLLAKSWDRLDACFGLFCDPIGHTNPIVDANLDPKCMPQLVADGVLDAAELPVLMATVKKQMEGLMGVLMRMANSKAVSDVIKDALAAALGPADGRPLTESDLLRLSREVAKRITYHTMRLDSREAVSDEENSKGDARQ